MVVGWWIEPLSILHKRGICCLLKEIRIVGGTMADQAPQLNSPPGLEAGKFSEADTQKGQWTPETGMQSSEAFLDNDLVIFRFSMR